MLTVAQWLPAVMSRWINNIMGRVFFHSPTFPVFSPHVCSQCSGTGEDVVAEFVLPRAELQNRAGFRSASSQEGGVGTRIQVKERQKYEEVKDDRGTEWRMDRNREGWRMK
ncbi:uncharacterized protein LOC144199083 [Stigmatopora nigra]